MANQDATDILPDTAAIIKRVKEWEQIEKKYNSVDEDINVFFDFDAAELSEEEDYEDSGARSEAECVEENEKEYSTALVEYQWNPVNEYKEKLLPIIKQKTYELEKKIRNMDFGVKVSDWLRNNGTHMPGPDFSTNGFAQPIRGRFMMGADLQFDNSNASSGSVNTAAYIMANKGRTRRRSSFKLMTIKEYCFVEQSDDILELENHQVQPLGLPQRSIPLASSHQMPLGAAPQQLAIEAAPQQLAIEAAPQPRVNGNSASKEQSSDPEHLHPRKSARQRMLRKRRLQRRVSSDSSDSDRGDEGDVRKSREVTKTPRQESAMRKSKSTLGMKSPKKKVVDQNIVIYQPPVELKNSKRPTEYVRITMEMLEEKIGRKNAEAQRKNTILLRPVPSTCKIVYNANKRSLYGASAVESDNSTSSSNDDSMDKQGKSKEKMPKENENSETAPPRNIVIYAPSKGMENSKKTFRLTVDHLRGKVEDAVIEKLKKSGIFNFPHSVGDTIMYNTHSKTLFRKM
ncbi:uncharacterized protein LOC129790009 [Lutzomyia longipalpis]|uniref:uncharacterized protein LOC129790009 n=1 Tax=Lutzomyia longipalpis TaxID=7200 RepID=UPI002484076B|nr:uncharacterized protein LOC129790009 [Lutzomyia longipalpis]